MAGDEIRVEGVSKQYGDVFAVRDVDVTFEAGSWVSLMGPSGSGKSTLLHLVGAMDRPTRGRVLVGGVDVAGLAAGAAARFRRERVGFVFQQHHMVPYLTALENVMLAQHFHSVADAAEARAALEAVGLSHRVDHLPSQLSGGERQRACVARALVNEPGVLLLDEPTGNLDSANARAALDLLAGLQRDAGFTVACATHDAQVAAWGDRIVRLRDGGVVGDERAGSGRARGASGLT